MNYSLHILDNYSIYIKIYITNFKIISTVCSFLALEMNKKKKKKLRKYYFKEFRKNYLECLMIFF